MQSIVLEQDNHIALSKRMTDDTWVVACLCAAWCDVCTAYRPGFDALAADHPDVLFVWIDVEDQADLVGDFDIENFPTVLIQRGDQILFYGTSLPDPRIATRLLTSHMQQSDAERHAHTQSSVEHREWQEERNLRQALQI